MKTVYVFGAGASFASPNVHAETDTKNPLDKAFWVAAKRLSLLDTNSYLSKFLQVAYGDLSNLDKVGMEEVYTFVDNFISILEMGGLSQFDHLDDKDDLRRPIALLSSVEKHEKLLLIVNALNEVLGMAHSQTSLKFLQFFRHIEKELIELIYNVFLKINSQWNCTLHNKFIEKILPANANSTIISFNYDLLLDNAFMSRGMTANVDFSYYIWLHQYGNVGGFEGERKTIYADFRKPYAPQDKIELLKLHGSLNWFALLNHATLQPEADMFAGTGKENIAVNTPYDLYLNGGAQYNKYNVLLQRALIAPILEKLKKFKSTFSFESLWTRALEKLSQAEKIVFIGYSLPPADYLAKWLFRMGYTLNSNKNLAIQIVNPEQSVESECQKIYFAAKFQARINSFSDFIASL
jgi:hypothetical protein